jgi:hypothetical protein
VVALEVETVLKVGKAVLGIEMAEVEMALIFRMVIT